VREAGVEADHAARVDESPGELLERHARGTMALGTRRDALGGGCARRCSPRQHDRHVERPPVSIQRDSGQSFPAAGHDEEYA